MLSENVWNKYGCHAFHKAEPPLCRAAGRTKLRIMNDKTGKKTKASGNQQVVKEAVSSKLKAYYDDIARQEVPQRFLDLLKDLDKAGEKPE